MSYASLSRANFRRPLILRTGDSIARGLHSIRAKWRELRRQYYAWFDITV